MNCKYGRRAIARTSWCALWARLSSGWLVAALLPLTSALAEEGDLSLEAGPVGDHLEKAQAQLDEGGSATALLEFEQVLTFDNVSPYLNERTDIYAAAAEDYAQGKRLSTYAYAEGGGGHYREEDSRTTDNLGIEPTRSDYWRGRAGAGLGYILADNLTLDATLDYRHVDYSDSDIRDDRDLRWRATLNRSLDNGSQAVGVRGRASYRGSDGYRQDYGLFANRGFNLDTRNRLVIEGEIRTRKYPQGVERNRSRDIGEVWLRWTRAFIDDTAAFTLALNGGQEWETNDRPSGDQDFYGIEVSWSQDFNDRLGLFLFGLWEHNGFHEDIPVEDVDGVVRPLSPDLDVYELGGGLTWEFSPGWTLRPQVLYLRDEGDTPFSDYESIEAWMTVRLAF